MAQHHRTGSSGFVIISGRHLLPPLQAHYSPLIMRETFSHASN